MSMFSTAAGDLVRSGGSFVRVSGSEEVRQHVQTRVLLLRGETPLNVSLGVDYVGLTGVGDDLIESALRDQILDTPGIVDLTSGTLEAQTTTQAEARERTFTWAGQYESEDQRERRRIHDRVTIFQESQP